MEKLPECCKAREKEEAQNPLNDLEETKSFENQVTQAVMIPRLTSFALIPVRSASG